MLQHIHSNWNTRKLRRHARHATVWGSTDNTQLIIQLWYLTNKSAVLNDNHDIITYIITTIVNLRIPPWTWILPTLGACANPPSTLTSAKRASHAINSKAKLFFLHSAQILSPIANSHYNDDNKEKGKGKKRWVNKIEKWCETMALNEHVHINWYMMTCHI